MLNIFQAMWKTDTPRAHTIGFYDANKPFHEANCKQWYKNLADLRGRQWAIYETPYSARLTEVMAPSWRKRATFNKLLPLSRIQRRKFMPNNPTITVRPANINSEKDKINAENARMLLKATWHSKRFKKQLNKFGRWMVSCTVGYFVILWDGRAGVEVEPGVGTGDVIIEAESPFCIVPDYSVDDFDEERRFVRVKVRSIDYIKEKYGKEVKPERIDVSSIYQLKAAALATGGNIDLDQIIQNHAMVFEMFELPSTKYKNGLQTACTRNVDLIEPKDLDPYYFKDKDGVKNYFLPREQAQSITIPGMLIGTNSVEQAAPAQYYYNEGMSRILENANRLGRPKVIAPEGLIKRGAMVDDPAEIIVELDWEKWHEGARIDTWRPPEMAQYHLDNIRRMPAEMQDAFSVHDASTGVLPRRATSGKAISFLVGQDDEAQGDPREEIDEAIEGTFRKALAIMSENYTESRIKDLIGDDGKAISRELKGEDLRVQDVTIIRDIAMPKSTAERMDFARAVLEKQATKEQVKLMFDIMEASTTEDLKAILTGNSEAVEMYARMETFDLAKGIERPVSLGEPHDMHKQVHSEQLKNPNVTEQGKMTIMKHNMAHDQAKALESQIAGPGQAGVEGEEEEEISPEVLARAGGIERGGPPAAGTES